MEEELFDLIMHTAEGNTKPATKDMDFSKLGF
jgi:hypothetical protein